MPSPTRAQQFILLPVRGSSAAADTPELVGFFRSLSRPEGVHLAAEAQRPSFHIKVLDSIREDGAKLVEMTPETVQALRRQQPGMCFIPLRYFRTAVVPRMTVVQAPKAAGKAVKPKIRVTVVSAKDGRPVPQAMVVAFTDFANGLGAQGTTNQRGEVDLALNATRKTVERLYVYPRMDYWGALRKQIQLAGGTQIALEPADPGYPGVISHFYAGSADTDGRGLTVGVIDTGVGPHPDLTVDGGLNTVEGEDPGDFGDNGAQHGTHVAGIIAARGLPSHGLRGLAPGARLRSYRVFGKKSEDASNYAIAKAIDAAAADGCDLINMSLGGGAPDEATRLAIEDARARGTLILAAAGNQDRSPVSFPASDSMAMAVSAMGRKGTFPAGATESGDVAAPYGKDKKDFVAAFTNIGPEIDLIGPGVGIISSVPGGYAPMSGTSMACPAVTGVAARLLARHPEILAMPRNHARSDAMAQLLLGSAVPLGFGAVYEGQGLPRG